MATDQPNVLAYIDAMLSCGFTLVRHAALNCRPVRCDPIRKSVLFISFRPLQMGAAELEVAICDLKSTSRWSRSSWSTASSRVSCSDISRLSAVFS
jgi:hypothetical protein